MQTTQYQNSSLYFLKSFFKGGFVGGFAGTFSHPIQHIAMLKSTKQIMIRVLKLPDPIPSYSQLIKQTLQQKGIRGFWQGNLSKLITYIPAQALNFSFNTLYRNILNKNGCNLLISIHAGGMAGLTQVLLMYGLNTKMPNIDKKKQRRGLREIIQQRYRGVLSMFCAIYIYRGIYFGFYEQVKKQQKNGIIGNFLTKFIVTYLVSIVAGVAALPFDKINSAVMTQRSQKIDYAKSISKMFQQKGMSAFFKGSKSLIWRSVPAALCLNFYQYLE